jgi:photosystem II protein PsbQ
MSVIIYKGVFVSVLNLKNYWTGFQKIAIAFCLMLVLVGTLFAPVLTQPAIAQTGSKSAALAVAASTAKLQVLSDRFDRLEKFVYKQKWVDVITYIHGPFGEIRRELRLIAGQLSKTQKETANDLANSLFKNFVQLDIAAKAKDPIAAEKSFKNALQDFESIVDLVS